MKKFLVVFITFCSLAVGLNSSGIIPVPSKNKEEKSAPTSIIKLSNFENGQIENANHNSDCDFVENRTENILTKTTSLNNVSAKDKAGNLDSHAKSTLLMHADSGTIIYSNNENERLTIASMTKIMLLNFVFEAVDQGELALDEEIIVSDQASGMGGSQVFLQANKGYKASDLIKCVIVASANDASVALAEKLFGSEQVCVDKMNERCEEWKLNNTVFSNCTGLPKATQYSCAKDVATMLNKLVSHKQYFDYSNVWLDELTHPDGQKTTITNTNKLVKFYDGCDGGKTGFTNEAKFCLGATAKRGSMRLICVVIGEPSSKERFADVSSMFNYAFANYSSKTIIDSSRNFDFNVCVKRAKQAKISAVSECDYNAFSLRNEKCNYSYSFTEKAGLVAPLKKGEVVGEIIVYKDNVEIARLNAVTSEEVKVKNFFDSVSECLTKWKIAK